MVPIGALYEQLTKALVKIGIFIVYFLPFFIHHVRTPDLQRTHHKRSTQ